MYLDEFAARLHQLEDPYTDVQTRHAADQWLTQFRDSPQAWSTAQSSLSAGDPSLWPHAAQILAYKSKRQLAQIHEIEQRMELLHTLSKTLATLSSSSSHLPATAGSSSNLSSFRAVTQGLCTAIANLIVQLPTLTRPLETMGSLLDQHLMIEFLTILPAECDDAYAALQASTATDANEAAFLLKQRAGEWCTEVGTWLYNLINLMVRSQPQLTAYLNSPRGSPLNMQTDTIAAAVVVLPSLFVPSISCFSAWIKWGGLFYMAQEHWEYMLRLSSTVLICTGTAASIHNREISSSAAAAAAAVAGVEALSEAIDRPAPKTQRLLLEICLGISQHITTVFPLGSTTTNMTSSTYSDHYRHVTHVYTTYCSTNANVVASETTEGVVLRNVLLHLVALSGERAATSGVSYNKDSEEEDEDEETGGGVPAIDALGDILEALVDPDPSIQDVIEKTEEAPAMEIDDGSNKNFHAAADDYFFLNIQLLSDQERINFTSTALSVLLQYSQVPLPYLVGSTGSPTAPALPRGVRKFRAQAEWLFWLCGEILEANTFMQQLYSFFQTSSTGKLKEVALQALEVCFYATHKGAGGAFSKTENAVTISSPTPAPWLGPLLSLYAAAQELDPCQRHQEQQTAPTSPGSNIFQFHLLFSFATVAPPLMKAVASMPDQCRGLMELIFHQAGAAITTTTTAVKNFPCTIHSENFLGSSEDHPTKDMENESVVEAAAQAVCAALSSPTEVKALALAAGAVGAIDGMLAALTVSSDDSVISSSSFLPTNAVRYRCRDSPARKASQQLIIALVHVLHAHDQHAAASAQHVLRNRTLQPLVTAATAAAGGGGGGGGNTMYVHILQAFLEDLMALLNALESHIELTLESYSEQPWPVVGAVVNDAVTAGLTAWPDIMTALSQTTSGSSATTSPTIANLSFSISIIRSMYHDASQCLCSCIHLKSSSITPSLTPLLESIYSTFFLPGGHSTHRILCALLENTNLNLSDNTADSKHTQVTALVSATGSLLTHPVAQRFYVVGGGDSDPDAVCALLTLATCFLRRVSSNNRWNMVSATITTSRNTASNATSTSHQEPLCSISGVAPVIECVNLALRLAASNTACNNRGVCQRAISTLSAALVSILDSSCTALHRPLLQLCCSTSGTGNDVLILDSINSTLSSGGVVIMQGILLCLLSLYSLSFLPKIIKVMSDAALLATACCNGSQNQGASDQLAVVTHAPATALLQDWWNKARMNLERDKGTGVAASVQQASSVLNSLDWESLVAAAAGAGAGRNETYGRGLSEAKRGVQRAVRQLADQIKKNHFQFGG